MLLDGDELIEELALDEGDDDTELDGLEDGELEVMKKYWKNRTYCSA